jgi:hypothetical protein
MHYMSYKHSAAKEYFHYKYYLVSAMKRNSLFISSHGTHTVTLAGLKAEMFIVKNMTVLTMTNQLVRRISNI